MGGGESTMFYFKFEKGPITNDELDLTDVWDTEHKIHFRESMEREDVEECIKYLVDVLQKRGIQPLDGTKDEYIIKVGSDDKYSPSQKLLSYACEYIKTLPPPLVSKCRGMRVVLEVESASYNKLIKEQVLNSMTRILSLIGIGIKDVKYNKTN